MTIHEIQDAEYRRYLDTHNVFVYGGAAKVVCPLCKNDHVTCRFDSGSLWCVNTRCANPHHRRRNYLVSPL